MPPARIWVPPRRPPRPASGAGAAEGHSCSGAGEGAVGGVVVEVDDDYVDESRSRRRRRLGNAAAGGIPSPSTRSTGS